MLEFIRKRDGRLVAFEEQNIVSAIQKTVKAVGGSDMQQVSDIGRQVVGILEVIYKDGRIPTVENVQDLVEKILIENGHAKTAKAYILYRQQHASLRETKAIIKESIESMDSYLTQEDWRVNENFMLFGTYAQGFRPPVTNRVGGGLANNQSNPTFEECRPPEG